MRPTLTQREHGNANFKNTQIDMQVTNPAKWGNQLLGQVFDLTGINCLNGIWVFQGNLVCESLISKWHNYVLEMRGIRQK